MARFFIVFVFCINVFPIENDLNRLFADLAAKAPSAAPVAVAVFPLSVSAPGTSPEAGAMVAEYAVAFFSSQPNFRVVEREHFNKVAGELALSQTGAMEEGKALEAGRLLSAEYILTGSINEAMGKRLISARLIRTESGEVAAASSVTTEARQLDAFYKEALGEKTGVSGTIFRSAVAPGWGQFYTEHPVQGGVFIGLAALSVGALVWAILDYSDKADRVTMFNEDRIEPFQGESPAAFDAREAAAIEDKNDAGTLVNIAAGILAGVWVANCVDAAVCGKQQSRKVKELYFTSSRK